MTALTTNPPALHLRRLPGQFGPLLFCYGELSGATADLLQGELALMELLDHPVITLDLSDCSYVDVDGIAAVLKAFQQRREHGCDLIIVAGMGPVAHRLRTMSLDRVVPVFPTEEAAAAALRGAEEPLPAPATWIVARADALMRWQAVQEALEQAPLQELLHQLTSMTALCQRSEELFHERSAPAAARCGFCPLFHALGGRPEDVGCQSILEPLIEALLDGNRESARDQVAQVIRTIEQMPLPEDGEPPAPWRTSARTEY